MALAKKMDRIENVISSVQGHLSRAQSIRLWLGLAVFFLLVFSQVFKGLYLELIALVLLLPLFIYFFRKSRAISRYLLRLKALQSFYQHQVQFKQGLFHKETSPEDMHDSFLARDLDLGLLYANLNFSFSKQGENLFNRWLCQDFGSSDRQVRVERLKELSRFPGLVRGLQIAPMDNKVDFALIGKEINRSFFEQNIPWKWLIPLSWLAVIACLFLPMPGLVWKVVLLLYVGASLFYLGHTASLFSRLQDIHSDLSLLDSKMLQLEKLAKNLSFTPHLNKQQARRDLKSMSRLISLMSVKTNPILFYVLNIVVPWDFLLAELCEKSRKNFAKNFSLWSEEVVQIDVLSNFINLVFYHETHWPEVNNQVFLNIKGLSHPLLDQNKVIKNDFSDDGQRVFIITGSNMSGKSTFLRAVGLNFCLANVGAPVFAESFIFRPMDIVSCIRVSDSLRDGQSYFYAEVRRMKMILDRAQKQPVFFLIDEPLRGTNNRERLMGNKKYLQQIIELNARGFLSTHDLELTQLADEAPKISNLHFNEQWLDQDLKFDYKIKQGPSTSTNALKILEMEGLY